MPSDRAGRAERDAAEAHFKTVAQGIPPCAGGALSALRGGPQCRTDGASIRLLAKTLGHTATLQRQVTEANAFWHAILETQQDSSWPSDGASTQGPSIQLLYGRCFSARTVHSVTLWTVLTGKARLRYSMDGRPEERKAGSSGSKARSLHKVAGPQAPSPENSGAYVRLVAIRSGRAHGGFDQYLALLLASRADETH